VPLATYRKKRRFGVTSEPRGRRVATTARRRALRFVVHKHRASRLHYDVRLEWRGVLLSWAVPRGPSLDPSVKRLAVQVEDHPLEYRTFEGVIPAGEYGGGTVMIWDRGTWTPEDDDVDAALRKGTLRFRLRGKKLRGGFTLVRTRQGWLMIKRRDEYASDEDIATTQPRSVASKRLLAEIAHAEGGDVVRAASGDPRDEVRALLRTLQKTGS
jgi:bifunctional non-homologous end joining protein LigD